MSADREERLGQLAEELEVAVGAGESIDRTRLAERFELPAAEVERCVAAVELLHASMEEDLISKGGLRPPSLPEDYEVGEELGRGGMGIVYRAHQRSLDRDVALKVLRPGDLQFGDAIDRFEREARSLARLRHRHIVSVHEVGHADGFLYFTMDLIDGQTLAELVAKGKVTAAQAVRLLRQVCAAMAYAHSRGVVHRDLKPANILVDGEGDAFVVDFGLARDLGAAHANTLSGQLIGTPSYMSPEQALGDAEKIGEASDVYALGAILYECLAGKAPFAGKPLAQLMYAVLEEEPPRLTKVNPQVPRDLAVICEKAMAKRPEERYATVQALADDLERFAGGLPIQARPPSTGYRVRRFVGRHGAKLAVGGGGVAALLAVLWWVVLPSVLRNYQLDLGARLVAAGNDAGALHAYRAAFEERHRDRFDQGTRLRYIRLLVDQAARDYWERGKDAWDDAGQLLDEAGRIANGLYFLNADGDEPALAEIELSRLHALRGDGTVLSTLRFPKERHLDRLHADLRVASRRPAALIQLAASWIFAGTPLDRDAKDGLLELIKRSDRMPRWLQQHLRPRSLHLRAEDEHVLGELRDRESVQGLMRIVAGQHPLSVRFLAARVLDKWGPFPVAVESRYADDPTLVRGALGSMAAWIAEIDVMPRSAAYRKRVSRAAGVLFGGEPAAGDARTHIRRWLDGMTGGKLLEKRSDWLEFEKAHAKSDPRRWLLRALDWDIEPDAVTVDAVLARLRRPSRSNWESERAWLHNLLTLVAPKGIVPPRSPVVRNLVSQWTRLLGKVPQDRLRVRLASFVQSAGRAELRPVWSRDFELGPDESADWNELNETEPARSVLCIRADEVMPTTGKLRHHGIVRTRWTGHDVVVTVSAGDYREVWEGGGSRVAGTFTTSLGLGEVRVVNAGLNKWMDGGDHETVWTFACVEAAGTKAMPRTLDWWRQRMNQAFTAGGIEELEQNAAAGIATPMPSLRALELQAKDLHTVYREDVRKARLLAGDPRAIDDALSKGFRRDPAPDFWCRLATTTVDAKIRRAALAELEASALSPTLLTVLAAHEDVMSQMSPELRRRVDARGTVTGAYLSSRRVTIAWLLLAHLLVGFGLVWMSKNRARGRLARGDAMLVMVLPLGLHSCVAYGEFVWLPGWPALALSLIGATVFARSLSRHPWWVLVLLAWGWAILFTDWNREPFVGLLVIGAIGLWILRVSIRFMLQARRAREARWRELRSPARRRARRGGR